MRARREPSAAAERVQLTLSGMAPTGEAVKVRLVERDFACGVIMGREQGCVAVIKLQRIQNYNGCGLQRILPRDTPALSFAIPIRCSVLSPKRAFTTPTAFLTL